TVLRGIGAESGAALIQQKGLAEAMRLVTEATNGDTAALAAMFPNIRGLRGIGAAMTKEWGDFTEAQNMVADSWKDGGAAAKVFEIQMESTSFKVDQAIQAVRNAAI